MTKQIILTKDQKMVYDYLSIADSYSGDIAKKLGISRRKVDCICTSLEYCGLIKGEKTTFKDAEGYYHFSKIYSIVIDKDIEPIEEEGNKMDILELLQKESNLSVPDIAIKTNLRIDEVDKQLKDYMQIGIVYYKYCKDTNGEIIRRYLLDPDILYIKNIKPKVEVWDSKKFLEENEKLRQMIDMDFMLTI